jgi:hypothetical protein
MRRPSVLFPVLVAASLVFALSCEGSKLPYRTDTIVKVTPEPESESCTHDGQKIAIGQDVNDDGALSDDEVTGEHFVCNGADGGKGSAGNDAPAAVVRVEDEAAGTNCEHGGQAVLSGVDTGGDGVLDLGEVTTTTYVCNGAPGADGEAGEDGDEGHTSLMSVEDEAAGTNCEHGGKAVHSGVDTSGDGVLDEGEVSGTTYVCDGAPGAGGADGHNALVSTAAELPGANCGFGGHAWSYGVDDDDSGTLDPAEVDGTAHVCSGACGDYECGGNCGPCNPAVADSCIDARCACGSGPPCTGDETCEAGVCKTPPQVGCSSPAIDTTVPFRWAFALADIDGDNDLDLAGTGAATAVIFKRQDDGSYVESQTLATEDNNDVYAAVFGDVTNDGQLDLVTAGPNGSRNSPNSVAVNAAGTFSEPVTVSTSHNIWFYGSAVVSADFNGDSIADVAWPSAPGLYVGLGPYLSGTDPTKFETGVTLYEPPQQERVDAAEVVDLDSDGDLDVVVVGAKNSKTGDGNIVLWINDGNGIFSDTWHTTGETALFSGDHLNPKALAVGDFDGDGAPDLAFANYSEAKTGIFLAVRSSADSEAPTYDFSQVDLGDWTVDNYIVLAAADLDADGDDDLIANGDRQARRMMNNGDATFTVDSCSLGNVRDPIFTDFNGDSRLDLVYGDGNSDTVKIRYAQ